MDAQAINELGYALLFAIVSPFALFIIIAVGDAIANYREAKRTRAMYGSKMRIRPSYYGGRHWD